MDDCVCPPAASDSQPKASVLQTILAAVTAVATMFAMLFVARKDIFAEVDRVERLKEVILKVRSYIFRTDTNLDMIWVR